MGIKVLKFIGDSDLVVQQVKYCFGAKNERLRCYKHDVWDTIELFDVFAIETATREHNSLADSLLMAASILQPCKNLDGG